MTRKIFAIIPASGIGERMKHHLPKQYLKLKGKTLLEYAIIPFLYHPAIEKIIIAVAENDPHYAGIALLKSPKIEFVFGGETRAQSVFNALKTINEEDAWAVVHDAARPCLALTDLDNVLAVEDRNGAILAIPVVDTMKRVNGMTILHTEDRSTLWHALTPQFFPAYLLKQALQSAFNQHLTVTDEASAMELYGYNPQLIAGRSDNLKVTRPEDLALAEFYLNKNLEK